MDLTTCYCRNRQCDCYGVTGTQARLVYAGWRHEAQTGYPAPAYGFSGRGSKKRRADYLLAVQQG